MGVRMYILCVHTCVPMSVCTLTPWGTVCYSHSLCVERQIEDHEVINDVLNTWPKKNSGHFVLREIYGKYRLWTRPSVSVV